MRYILFFIYRTFRYFYRVTAIFWSTVYTKSLFYIFNVQFGARLKAKGIPIIDINPGCKVTIGNNFRINSGLLVNRIGRQQHCFFVLDHKSTLAIGNNVGLSSTAIVCHYHITIGDNVRTGGNTVIYDTDFHSLDAVDRQQLVEDKSKVKTKAVHISDNVFIGAHTTILKGVTIGKNSIIGACSLVTRDIPENQIWGGNPAKYIKDI